MEQKQYKIVVVSDSHGDTGAVRYALSMEQPVDMLIHCGDIEDDLDAALGSGRDYDLKMVRGNMDFARSDLPSFLLFEFAGHRFFVAHGDRYSVSYSVGTLWETAKKYKADVVLYGHTHVPDEVKVKGGIIVNPGSVSRPRGGSRRGYAVLTVEEGKPVEVELKSFGGSLW